MQDRERRPARIVASGWYAANLGDRFVGIEEAIAGRAAARALARVRPGRGLLIYLAARRGRGAALKRLEPGALSALALAALFGGARIVVLELIPDRPARSGWRRGAKRLWERLVERPAVRHGMATGHVLSAAERDSTAALYGIERERLRVVPWAWSRTAATSPSAAGRAGVLASGRAACDWETLFAAAKDAEWPLTVVCGEADGERVRVLNASGRATVLSEIPRADHDRLMASAALFAMPLHDDGLSSGQVRLQTATELGTPVIATRVRSLADYAIDGETAMLVPAGDPAALRAAIEALLADPERRRRLAAAAFARGRARTYPDFFGELGEMIEASL